MRLQNKDRLEEKDIKSMVALFHEHELSLIPENEELQERYHPSDLFRRNMEIIIESQKKKKRRRNLWRICTAAAAIVVVLGIAQPQMTAKGTEWLVHWLKDHVSFRFGENTDINQVPTYEFGYIPEGFRLVMDDYSDISGYILYENEQGNRFDLAYGDIGGELNVDSENKDFTILTGKHGEKIYYLRSQNPDDDSFMTWLSKDGTTVLNIMSDLPEEELLKLQESVRMTKEK